MIKWKKNFQKWKIIVKKLISYYIKKNKKQIFI